jgi:hypothetical protein
LFESSGIFHRKTLIGIPITGISEYVTDGGTDEIHTLVLKDASIGVGNDHGNSTTIIIKNKSKSKKRKRNKPQR